MTPLLLLRRAKRDLALLLVWMALVAFAVVLAVAQPRILQSTIDQGARQAVASAGARTDVVLTAAVSPHNDDIVTPLNPKKIDELSAAIPSRLPSALRAVYGGDTLSVLGPQTRIASLNGAPLATASRPVAVQVALISAQDESGLKLAQGSMPASAAANETDVLITAADATAAGIRVGDVVTVSTIPVASGTTGGDHLALHVVGIVGSVGDAHNWTDVPNLTAPSRPKSASSPLAITVLTDQPGLQLAAKRYANPFTATIRIALDPKRFTTEREAAVTDELTVLATHSESLAGPTGAQLGVVSEYPLALADFPAQERAAVAQISIVAAGVLGVAAAVLLLVSRMLVSRRALDLRLERARGASLPAIFGRSFAETLVLGVVGAAIGELVANALEPGALLQPELLAAVLVVAALAVPTQTVLEVRGAWAGRRVPANRADRLDLERRAHARRIAVELTVIALGIASFVSLVSRGLLETQTSGVDPLLASAPLLLAAAVTIVVLRVYRWPLLLAISGGRRSDGALGLLAAARAQRSIAVLPLLALTLAVALAISGGLLAATVAAGQQTGAWQRTGADVRVNAVVTAGQLSGAKAAPGVSTVTAIHTDPGLQFRLTSGTNFATVIAVDNNFSAFVHALPAGGASPAGVAALQKLEQPSTSATLPVVVNSDFARQITSTDVGFYDGIKFLPIRVVGVTDFDPEGYLGSPFVFVNRQALAAKLGKAVPTNIVLLNGSGALAAAKAMGVAKTTIHSREQWLEARTHLALVSGVNRAIGLSTLSAALLAVIALIVTVLSGARERGRSLGLVRTLGLPARLGWWLALAELAPVLIAALIGGVVAGVAIVLLLEPAMGLQQLAGSIGSPAPAISPSFIAGLVGVAIGLLALAVLIEIAVRRRDRLSEVLRVGETT